ncbi:MFS transporter [Ruicaihuangia caeni]|uniref:MFS transporter n=1 Tax=Ruicaihuangia caeni TaxID=3042517 RepID=UPI00338F5411
MTIPTHERETVPRFSRDVYVLAMIAFFVMVGFGVVIPVLPVFVRTFEVGYLEVGMVVSAFALMRLLASPFVGRMIDRTGERIILSLGIGIVAISTALTGLANSYLEVLLMRGAGGIGSAMFSISAMSLLISASPPSMRGRAVGMYQGGFLIGGMAGPAVGGLLAAISIRAPFFFYAGTLVVAGAVGLVLLHRGDGAGRGGAASGILPMRVVLRDQRYRAALIANFSSGWASLGVRSALIPVLVVEVLHKTELWTGIALAVAAVAQTAMLWPAGRFVDKVGRRPAIAMAFAVGALCMAFMPFASEIWQLIALLCVYGAAAAFMGTAPAAAVGDAAGGRGGQPVAVFSATSDIGSILGPLVVGVLADAVSFPAAFATAVLFLLVTAGYAAFRMPSEREVARRSESAGD